MKKLYVYADFDWLKGVELIGELGYEALCGADSYSFNRDSSLPNTKIPKHIIQHVLTTNLPSY